MIAMGCGGGGGGGGGDTPDGGSGDAPAVVDDAATPGCGDGTLNGTELCDDHNTIDGDGCSADCSTIETGFACGDPGDPCVPTHVCGNGLVEDLEACDDHNTNSLDGCSASCVLEAGWTCPVPGIRCSAAMCGDGIVAGFEECDDHAASTPGCSATCQLEDGFACATPNTSCVATICGDGIREGTEECDDMNHDLGDGCDPLCHREPVCNNGTCAAVCGDGVVQTGEACDDGNLHDADGCSSLCVVEFGFTCTPSVATEPTTLKVAVVYRDFRRFDSTPAGHIDFNNFNGAATGLVKPTLGANGKPEASANLQGKISSAATFAQWYTDVAGVNMTYAETLTLDRTGPATYVFDSGAFFPLDGRGFVGAGTEVASAGHNFSFTSELRYWFTYTGTEVLSFRGDDDVWVFINKRLAVDLGGIHGAATGSVTLDAATNTTLGLGLTIGGTYEAVVFQAERHTNASSYKLTLKGFNAAISQCDDVCGDGKTSSYEVCDDGTNMGGYGSCTADCLGFGPRCGDHIVQSPQEQCDDGVNTGGYNKCLPTCQLGPRCGDGIVQSPQEACDDGNTNDTDGCPNSCQTVIL